jgi:hypothetical protein
MPPKSVKKVTETSPKGKAKAKQVVQESESESSSETESDLDDTLSFELHNKSVIDIAEYIEKQKQDLDKLYGEKILELCKNSPSTKIYENINHIYENVYGQVKLESLPNINYWYDINH